MSILDLNDTRMALPAQRQRTQPGCAQVELYRFVSAVLDMVLHTDIPTAFSWVEPLGSWRPTLISFPAVPWSWRSLLTSISCLSRCFSFLSILQFCALPRRKDLNQPS